MRGPSRQVGPSVGLLGAAVALVFGGSALLGCGADPDEPSGTPSASATPLQSPTPTPTPQTSPEEYAKVLADAGGPVDAALTRAARAKSVAGVKKAMAAASEAAAQAVTKLKPVPPPPGEEQEYLRLVAALERLRDDTAAVSRNGTTDSSCTAPATAASVASGLDIGDLHRVVRALRDKGFDPGIEATMPKPTTRRPRTGTFVTSGSRTGYGTLTIQNGSDSDALVAFGKGKKQVFSVYVRKGDDLTVKGIRYGTYIGYVATGTDFDRRAKGFTRDCGFKRFDDEFSYPRGYRSQYTITLHTVIGGNASTTELGPDGFPS